MRVERLRWSKEAEQGLGTTLDGFADEFERQVNAGFAELWKLGDDTYMITRVERCRGKAPELVVCCLCGRGLDAIAPAVIDAAKGQGIGSIRVHSKRPGMSRALAQYGFTEAERVFRLNLEPPHG